MSVKPIPEGYYSITPYLIVSGAAGLIDFVTRAFDATEIFRTATPDGTVMHAEIRIGNSMIMVSESREELPPMPTMLYFYVEDVDTMYGRAIDAGATSIAEPTNHFYGDRSGGVKDPYGNQWWIATHIEDVSAEEIARRAEG